MAKDIAGFRAAIEAGTASPVLPLRLFPEHPRNALRAIAASLAIVTAAGLILDVVVFRDRLPAWYIEHFRELSPRSVLTVSLWAATAEVYRGLLMTGVLAALSLQGGRPSAARFIFAIAAAQLVLVWPAVIADPLYGLLRCWAVGCVWGWLFWRHGWLSALAAHSAVHILLDPMLRIALY